MLFDKNGMFRIDEVVATQPTFQKIMEDRIVTDEELEEHTRLVISLLKHMEKNFPPEQLAEVEKLLAEMSVLHAIYQYKEIQDLYHKR